MRILLVDADSKIPNIALMKLASWHKVQGNEVNLHTLQIPYYPHKRRKKVVQAVGYGKVYVSGIFSGVGAYIDMRVSKNTAVTYGGTGFEVSSKLPVGVASLPCDYSLYPGNETSYGFMSRGCIRRCSFCCVPEKEGGLKYIEGWQSIVKHKRVEFLDNNFLALPEHKKILKELRDSGTRCRFMQGLDIRLVDDENAALLAELRYMGEYIFAFDNVKALKLVAKGLSILKRHISKPWRIKMYVYIHPRMPILEDIVFRVEWLRENRVLPYIMRDASCFDSKNNMFYTDMASWCNQPGIFKGLKFTDFLSRRHTNSDRINISSSIYAGIL